MKYTSALPMRAKEYDGRNRVIAQMLTYALLGIFAIGGAFVVILAIDAATIGTLGTGLVSVVIGLGIGSVLLVAYQADLHHQWHEEWVTVGQVEVVETPTGARIVNLTIADEHAPTVIPYSLTYATRIANLHAGQTIMIVRRSTSFSSVHCEGRLR